MKVISYLHEQENKFIQKLVDTKIPSYYLLINGIKLSGVITAMDESTLYHNVSNTHNWYIKTQYRK